MIAGLLIAAAATLPGETSMVGRLPPDIAVKSWINTKGWKSLADLRGNVVLLEFWATW